MKLLHALSILCAVALAACASPPQPPADYLRNALDWIEAHAVLHDRVADWPALRAEAIALAPQPATAADTYPAIRHVLAALNAAGDDNAFLLDPGQLGTSQRTHGYNELKRDGTIVFLAPGGPAERAGLLLGDQITHVDGVPHTEYIAARTNLSWRPIVQLRVQRPGEANPREITLEAAEIGYEGRPQGRPIAVGDATVGYLELPWDWGSAQYPTRAQAAIRAAGEGSACGWIIDLRRNTGGNMWSFLAAAGPILGPGELGGFVDRDGRRTPWSYRDGEVRWDGHSRGESTVEGTLAVVPARPLALLISPATTQGAETALVAFIGRPDTRLFGEPTYGLPLLVDHTPLSDGAELFVSGARAYNRGGALYDGPIAPDELVATDWLRFGADDDPVIGAALAWLATRPSCSG